MNTADLDPVRAAAENLLSTLSAFLARPDDEADLRRLLGPANVDWLRLRMDALRAALDANT